MAADVALSEKSAVTAKLKRGSPGFLRIVTAFFIGGFAIFELLYCVQPLLPEFARRFGLTPASASLAVSVSTVAMASSLFFGGLAAERFGRKPVMVASLIASALGTLAAALAPSWPALLVSRGLMGLALAGLPSVAMAYLAEEIEGPALGFAMGLYIAGSTLGGMFGRLVVGAVADRAGWRVALALMGAISLVGAGVFARSLPAERRPAPSAGIGGLVAALKGHFADEGLPWLFAVGYLVMGAFICTYNYISFRLAAAPFSLDQTRIGLIFTLYLIGALSSTVMGDLAARLGRRRVLWMALVIGVAGTLVTLPDYLPTVVLGVAMVTWSFFGAHSIASSWVGLRAAENRAQASALYLFFYYVGSSLNGWMGGLAYQRWGWPGVATLIGLLLGFALLAALKLARVPPPRHLR
jgi:YNFM family putative membrane transporter